MHGVHNNFRRVHRIWVGGALLVLAIGGLSLWWRERAASTAGSAVSKSVNPNIVGQFERMGNHQEFVESFGRVITNAASGERWRQWASATLAQAAGKPHDSALLDGVALRKGDLPDFVPERDGLVGAVVMNAGESGAHVDLCWGGHGTFYGVLVGGAAYHPKATNRLTISLGDGIYAYLLLTR